MTAAQLDALTTITAGAAGGTFSVAVSDTAGPVTVDLSDTNGPATNVDSITFASVLTGAVTVTIDENVTVVGGSGADVLNITASLGAVTVGASAFETVNFTTAAQAGAVTAPVGATTINSSVAQTGLTIAAVTTAVNTSNATGAAVLVDNAVASSSTTFTHTGAGTMTVTMTAETTTPAADTVTVSGSSGAVTVNLIAASGITTINLNSSVATVDTINFSDGGATVGVVAAVDRAVVSGFGATDVIRLDDTQTTQTGGNVIQSVAAAGAVTVTTAITSLSYEMGGVANVLGGDLTGASLLANGGAFTVASGDDGYIIAYDGGNAYLYRYINDTDTALAANEIALIGVFNGVAVGAIGSANITIGT